MMEGVPSCLRLEDVSATICSVPGVVQVHDLHVWGVCSAHIILSAHAVIDDQRISQAQMIIAEMKRTLRELFGIEHTTIQLEWESCGQGSVVGRRDNDKTQKHDLKWPMARRAYFSGRKVLSPIHGSCAFAQRAETSFKTG